MFNLQAKKRYCHPAQVWPGHRTHRFKLHIPEHLQLRTDERIFKSVFNSILHYVAGTNLEPLDMTIVIGALNKVGTVTNEQQNSIQSRGVLDDYRIEFQLYSGEFDSVLQSLFQAALNTEQFQIKDHYGFDLHVLELLLRDMGITSINTTDTKIVFVKDDALEANRDNKINPDSIEDEQTYAIMVIDDNRFLRETLEALLVEDGHKISAFSTAEEALDELRSVRSRSTYDALIVDYRLPRMNGEMFWRQICTEFPKLAQRVILTTGLSYLPPKGLHFLSKPFTKAQVLSVIEVVKNN